MKDPLDADILNVLDLEIRVPGADRVKLIRRNRNLQHGDITLILPNVKEPYKCFHNIILPSDITFKPNKNRLDIWLNRPQFIRTILGKQQNSRDVLEKPKTVVIVRHFESSHLRVKVTADHLTNLYTWINYDVTNVPLSKDEVTDAALADLRTRLDMDGATGDKLRDELLYVAMLENLMHVYSDVTCLVHVIPHERAQAVANAVDHWRKINTNNDVMSKEYTVICGTMSLCDKELREVREAQLRESYRARYGAQVDAGAFDSTLLHLADAAIRLETLSRTTSQPAKINQKDVPSDVMFVLYNYARLATLLSNYESRVEEGAYPRLDDVSCIDYSLLREEQEWVLVYCHILEFRLLKAGVDRTGPLLNVHKMTHFLLNLSRDLSVYYTHTHVLCASHAHLMPQLNARIVMLREVHRVYKKALEMIGVTPVETL